MVAYAFNPNTWEAVTGKSVESEAGLIYIGSNRLKKERKNERKKERKKERQEPRNKQTSKQASKQTKLRLSMPRHLLCKSGQRSVCQNHRRWKERSNSTKLI